MRVCGWTPSTAEITSTAPSSTLEHPLDLGDEVRVAGRVDQVDVTSSIANDATADLIVIPRCALERERVGLGRAGVDAADVVDDAGLVQQPLGEGGLTGVYMRQDSKVELSLRHASYPPSGSQRTCGRV